MKHRRWTCKNNRQIILSISQDRRENEFRYSMKKKIPANSKFHIHGFKIISMFKFLVNLKSDIFIMNLYIR